MQLQDQCCNHAALATFFVVHVTIEFRTIEGSKDRSVKCNGTVQAAGIAPLTRA